MGPIVKNVLLTTMVFQIALLVHAIQLELLTPRHAWNPVSARYLCKHGVIFVSML